MKILMLISSLELGGVETHVYELSKALVALGAQVTVVSSGGTLSKKLSCLGIKHISLPLDSRMPNDLFRSYFGVCNILRKENFDIVHAHSRIAAYIGNAAAKCRGVSFVTTVHAKFSVSPIKRHMSRWGEYTSAVSEDLEKYILENYRVKKEKIRIIPNGIDTERFTPSTSRGMRNNTRILFVSRLDSDCSKSAYSLCHIAEKLAKAYPGIKITILGGGDKYGEISVLATKVNEKMRYTLIETPGAVSDVEKYISESDIFIGVSRAALEAASSGVRVILSGDEGFLGVLCENNVKIAEISNFCCRGYPKISDERLFESISNLIAEDKETSSKTAKFLRDYVIKYHGIGEMASKTLAFYRETLEKRLNGKSGICLCGYYGFGNIGDDSLLVAALERGRREKVGSIVVLSKFPQKSEKIFGVSCVSRYNIISVISAIRRSDTLVFGGGTLFQDGTSLRSIIYYSSLAFIARILKKEVQLWANGLGPVESCIGKKLLSGVLGYASHIGIRDMSSQALARSLGADEKNIVFECDLAVSLTPISEDNLAEIMQRFGLKTNERFTVFSISGRAENREYHLIKKRAQAFLKNGVRVIIVGMYPKEDRLISQRLCNEIGGEYIEKINGRELLLLLKYAEAAVGMRLHLLVFSKVAGISFEGVGKEPKIISFCKENGGGMLL